MKVLFWSTTWSAPLTQVVAIYWVQGGPKILFVISGRTALPGISLSGEIIDYSYLYNIELHCVPSSELRHMNIA